MENRNNNSINNRNDNNHLFRLGELDDYKVASGNPDVRGWDIVDRNKQKLGTVNELVVDVDREKVRYLDVAPTGDTFRGDEEHRLLIPIGAARINDNDNRVMLSELDRERLNSFPTHRGEAITRDYEYEVVDRFNARDGVQRERRDTRDNTSDFYDNNLYNEDSFYSNQDRSTRL